MARKAATGSGQEEAARKDLDGRPIDERKCSWNCSPIYNWA